MGNICGFCGRTLKKDEQPIEYKGKKLHSKCFNNMIKAISVNKREDKEEALENKKVTKKVKPKAELKEGLSEEEYADKRQFYDYLKSKGEELDAKTYVLTERYISLYGCTYKELYETAYYIYEVIEKNVELSVIGLIPYYLKDAIGYFKNLEKIELYNAGVNVEEMYNTKTININKTQKKKRGNLINMEDI